MSDEEWAATWGAWNARRLARGIWFSILSEAMRLIADVIWPVEPEPIRPAPLPLPPPPIPAPPQP